VAAVTLSLLFILSGVDFLTRVTHESPWQATPPSLYMESGNDSTATGKSASSAPTGSERSEGPP